MDAAPLTQAHLHARNAAQDSQKADFKAAAEKHELAAGEFTQARENTHESEAIRILSLLEEHHRRLALTLRSPNALFHAIEREPGRDTRLSEKPRADSPELERSGPPTLRRQASSPTRTRRDAHKELSSSIANNLATARGKPSNQRRSLLSTAEAAPPHTFTKPASADRPQHVPPLAIRQSSYTEENTNKRQEQKPGSSTAADEGFNRFFTSFEGLFSKLSAPLAFAGLPLTAESAQEDAQQLKAQAKAEEKERREGSTVRVRASDHEPDLANIYSKAALRVIREDGGNLGIQDSFYWVPPSGGTQSYAGMLSASSIVAAEEALAGGEGYHHAHLVRQGSSNVPETIEEDGEQEFVDAKEEQQGSGHDVLAHSRQNKLRPGGSRPSSRVGGRTAGHMKTMEELELENAALRRSLDTQSKRLQMWEASSQSQSMALAQSMRAGWNHSVTAATAAATQHPPSSTLSSEKERDPNKQSTTKVTASDTQGSNPHGSTQQELEEQIAAISAERDNLARRVEKMTLVNEQQLVTIGKYRARWEELKAGAKKRLDRGDSIGVGGGGGGSISSASPSLKG